MKHKLILLFAFILVVCHTFGQTVTNVFFMPDEDKIMIGYTITSTADINSFDIELWVAPKCSNDFTKIPETELKGDFGKNITTGTKYIKWYPTKPLDYPNCCFKVKASYTGLADLSATVTVKNLPETVYIKGGTFTMGSNDGEDNEKPPHEVTLTDFEMSKYEVTNAQFAEFLNDYGQATTKTTSDYPSQTMIYDSKTTYSGSYNWGLVKSGTSWTPVTGYEDFPIIYVTWYGAYEYCKWLSEKTGKKCSLPTEAQWEYAAGGNSPSGGREQKYAGTDDETKLGDYAWYSSNSDSKTHKVGTKTANSLGLYDMSGNVWEWCLDWYSATYYTSAAVTNPVNTTVATYRVLRGGSYYSSANYCYTANRNGDDPYDYDYNYGFRFVFGL